MDLQMPVLDGYEATRRIRAWEARTNGRPSIPILALTASALESELGTGDRGGLHRRGFGNRFGCTAASAALVKSIAELGTDGHHLKAEVPADDPASRGRPGISQPSPARRWHHSQPRSTTPISERFASLGHKMSGTGGGYGFPRISEIGAALESAARRTQPRSSRAQVDALSGIWGGWKWCRGGACTAAP